MIDSLTWTYHILSIHSSLDEQLALVSNNSVNVQENFFVSEYFNDLELNPINVIKFMITW